ncbi:hypothetical protein GZH47_20780 [Paenibacillus rhizovicinus]|uniref:SRPBCC family protein n=1 Tax=Paenibacillus rhizovicinus TaxID=2704463 RepID=A0A6C0P3C9_9BACL|nr:SRPBCC family protein [Paenibacillus rhizovicinus]QHW32989.1 hypothetical protein GZH47_20780 [Paenibacillus rhizovicinus]
MGEGPGIKEKSRTAKVWLGIACGNGLAVILLLLSMLALKWQENFNGVYIFADFIVVPIVIGIVNAYVLRGEKVGAPKYMLYGLYNLLVVNLGAALLLREGYICLLILSPLIYFFIMMGMLIGWGMFRKVDHRVNISILAGLGVLLVANLVTASPGGSTLVSDTVVIDASPDEVWKHVVAFDPITEKPEYWLFRIGLPSPVQSTAEGDFVGAWRKCIFSNGIVFDERIAELEPGVKLTFDITKQPDDPEIMGHLDLQKGQFILKDNGDGTTTLIGNSWYDLKVKPPLYFNVWAKSIVRNVHLEVMQHIKTLSEAA